VGGCAKDLADLAPFPCAKDGSCSSGLACVNSSCVRPEQVTELTASCADSSECPSGHTCVQGTGCVPDESAVDYTPFPCEPDKTCRASLQCVPGAGCVADDDLHNYTPFACKSDNTCPSSLNCVPKVGCAEADECSVLKQDCPTSRPKCALVKIGGTNYAQCVPQTASSGVGAACSIDTSGLDDCDKGLRCDPSSRECEKFCGTSVKCSSSEICGSIGSGDFGTCTQSCDPVAGCQGGSNCVLVNTIPAAPMPFMCAPVGSKDEGLECSSLQDCRQGMSCFTQRCRRACTSNSESCGESGSCHREGSNAWGTCQCQLFGCTEGQNCRVVGSDNDGFKTDVCMPVGSKTIGAKCTSGLDCPRNSICLGTASAGSVCKRLCDPSHECPSGSCNELKGLEKGGYCNGSE
jgi:hypothetical protein